MSDILQTSAGGPPGLTPPQALEAERSILAAMLLDESAIGRAVEMIESSAFYRTAHAKLYEAIVALYNTSTPADLITVSEKLRERGDLEAVGGPPFLAQIMEYATTAANIEQHIKIVHSKAILRQLIRTRIPAAKRRRTSSTAPRRASSASPTSASAKASSPWASY